MYKIYFCAFLFLILSINCFAQTKPIKESTLIDSLAEESRILKSLDSLLSKPTSYFQVGIGIGNQLYSTHNNALNAKQTSPPLVLTPSIGYFHKSGFSISANEYLLNENNTFGANQYSITPGFETQPNHPFEFLISYTHYFINNEYSEFSSPVQNDFYSSLVYKKPWLQPGVSLGYSFGESKQILKFDTTINSRNINLTDTATSSLNAFTCILSLQHSFGWKTVFSNDDNISFIPELMLNLGSSTTTVNNNDHLNAVLRALLTQAKIKAIRTALTKKIKKFTKLQSTPFGAESAAIDLQASYTFGNFSIQPDVYLDYYLPETTTNRFTQVYSINFNYSF